MTRNLPEQQRLQGIVSQFRNYDRCIHNWLKSFPVNDNDSPVPVVFSTPDRAFAAMNVLLKTTGQADRDIPIKNIPLPFISVSSGRIEHDPARYHGPVRIPLGVTEDGTSSYDVGHPLPYNITYRVEVWTKNQEILNIYKYWLAVSFDRGYERMLEVDLSDVWPLWERKLIPIANNGVNFVGEHEPDEGHRVLRIVNEFTLKGWIIPPIQETKPVHRIIVDVYNAKLGADISNVTGPDVEDDPITYMPLDHYEIADE